MGNNCITCMRPNSQQNPSDVSIGNDFFHITKINKWNPKNINVQNLINNATESGHSDKEAYRPIVDSKPWDKSIELEEIFIRNTIKIQSHFRKFLVKQYIRKLALKGTALTGKCFIEWEKSNIPKDEIDSWFQKHWKLNDNVPVWLKSLFYIGTAEYYGEWNPEREERHGRGIQYWKDRSKFIGMWKNNLRHGKGKFISPRGDYYEGDFENNVCEGYGEYSQVNGSKYMGMWRKGLQHGKGKEIWPDKIEYEGEYREGKKAGFGILKIADGSIYEGEFFDNQIHGKGKYTWFNKKVYEGDWKYSKIDGEGVFKWPDGRVYKGHYTNDKKEGYGVYEWGNGKIYKGEWHDGKQHGEGEVFNPSENKWWKGQWCEGKRVWWSDK